MQRVGDEGDERESLSDKRAQRARMSREPKRTATQPVLSRGALAAFDAVRFTDVAAFLPAAFVLPAAALHAAVRAAGLPRLAGGGDAASPSGAGASRPLRRAAAFFVPRPRVGGARAAFSAAHVAA